jgi:NAD(P)-dependent dehydrogenase (short-subunit alcohol dehydrogenase family)
MKDQHDADLDRIVSPVEGDLVSRRSFMGAAALVGAGPIALIEKAGRKAVAIPGDLSDDGFCKTPIEQAHRDLSGLDILAAVAGMQHAVEKIADLGTA